MAQNQKPRERELKIKTMYNNIASNNKRNERKKNKNNKIETGKLFRAKMFVPDSEN